MQRKHSVSINGHRTSFTLEDAFHGELARLAAARNLQISAMVAAIDAERKAGTNLSSAIRLFVLDAVRAGK